jgi:hypothetical protein
MEEQEKDEEQKKGHAIRRIAQAKPVAYLTAGAIGFSTVAPLVSQNIDGKKVQLPSAQPVGAMLSSSSATTAAGVIHPVVNTVIGLVYEGRYSRLAPEVEQGGGNSPVGFQLVLRST